MANPTAAWTLLDEVPDHGLGGAQVGRQTQALSFQGLTHMTQEGVLADSGPSFHQKAIAGAQLLGRRGHFRIVTDKAYNRFHSSSPYFLPRHK